MAAAEGGLLAVHDAIYATLSADATLLALATGGIYNDVPEGASYPHVLISRPREVSKHTMGGSSTGLGWMVMARVYTFSRYQGDKQALQIHGRIVQLLNFQSIAVSGFASAVWEYTHGLSDVKDIQKLESHFAVAEFDVRLQQ